MKNKQYEVSRIKKILLAKKRNGEKEVVWRLDSQAKKDEVDRLGFRREPWLYEIRTRSFKCIKDKPSFIKDIHYSYKRGKKRIVRHLNKEQLSLLHEYGISARATKYKIYLV